jgi:hypothetical protein
MNEKKYPFVSNPRDPRFLALRSLQTPQGRSLSGLYIIEGIRHLSRALEHTIPESIFLDPSTYPILLGKNSPADSAKMVFREFGSRISSIAT